MQFSTFDRQPPDNVLPRRIVLPRHFATSSAQNSYSIALERIAGTNVTGYSSVAALVFLIYDIMLTFSDEVKYIWPSPWNLTKFLYFFLRYFTVVLHITILFLGTPPFTFSRHDCYIWSVYQALASALLISSVDYILILRIFALYSQNRIVKSVMAALYIIEVIVVAVGFGLSVPYLDWDKYCTVVDAPLTFAISAAAPIAFQAVMFGVTIWKFFGAVKAGWGDVHIIRILVRDGTWAFCLLFAMLVAEGLLYTFAPDAYTSVLYGWLNTSFAFCGYRILHNIHSASRAEARGTINPTTGPNIQFTTHIYTGTELSDRLQLEESYPLAVITRSDAAQKLGDSGGLSVGTISGESAWDGSWTSTVESSGTRCEGGASSKTPSHHGPGAPQRPDPP